MLYFNLRPIFKARGIDNPFTYLVNNGITYHTAHRIINSQNRTLTLNIVERLCELLICEPNDLLAYKPRQNSPLRESHPLHNLKITDNQENSLHTATKELSYKQLKDLSNKVKQELSKTPTATTDPSLETQE